MYEAAIHVANYSNAWKDKIDSIDVNIYKPENFLNKVKEEGKFLEKIEPRMSVGIIQKDVFQAILISGPPTAVKKYTPFMITIVPGDADAKELGKEIKKQLSGKVPFEIQNATEQIDEKEIEKLIPFGKGKLVS